MELILATNNKNKVREFKEILSPLGYDVKSQSEAGISIEAEETGLTFEENAYLKAKALYDLKKTFVIADDSGLEIDALNGRPGVYSARYEGIETAEGRNKRVLEQLAELNAYTPQKRSARFACAICLILPGGEVKTVRGECEGSIAFKPEGSNGFGYDPIFLYGEKTLAQMTKEEKNSVSHRGNAIKKLLKIL